RLRAQGNPRSDVQAGNEPLGIRMVRDENGAGRARRGHHARGNVWRHAGKLFFLDPPVSGAKRLWVHGTIGTKHSGDTLRHGTKDATTKREGSGGAGMVGAGGMGRVTSHAECACRPFRRSGDPAGGAPKEKNRNSKPGLNRERDSPSAARRIQIASRPPYACQASAFQPGLPSRRRNHDPAAFPVDGYGSSRCGARTGISEGGIVPYIRSGRLEDALRLDRVGVRVPIDGALAEIGFVGHVAGQRGVVTEDSVFDDLLMVARALEESPEVRFFFVPGSAAIVEALGDGLLAGLGIVLLVPFLEIDFAQCARIA